MNNYQPISCDFYDELEARATLRRPCRIEFRDATGQSQTLEAVIKDLYIRSKVEYMFLSTGLEIRLDHLISVDGKFLPEAC
jgi:Rho-binding antiterminator